MRVRTTLAWSGEGARAILELLCILALTLLLLESLLRLGCIACELDEDFFETCHRDSKLHTESRARIRLGRCAQRLYMLDRHLCTEAHLARWLDCGRMGACELDRSCAMAWRTRALDEVVRRMCGLQLQRGAETAKSAPRHDGDLRMDNIIELEALEDSGD